MLWEHDVAGSNPAAPTNNNNWLLIFSNLFYVSISRRGLTGD
jgi:hypothetical protein